jgi:hypothetical protein
LQSECTKGSQSNVSRRLPRYRADWVGLLVLILHRKLASYSFVYDGNSHGSAFTQSTSPARTRSPGRGCPRMPRRRRQTGRNPQLVRLVSWTAVLQRPSTTAASSSFAPSGPPCWLPCAAPRARCLDSALLAAWLAGCSCWLAAGPCMLGLILDESCCMYSPFTK